MKIQWFRTWQLDLGIVHKVYTLQHVASDDLSVMAESGIDRSPLIIDHMICNPVCSGG